MEESIISVNQVQKLLNGKKPVFILDVRPLQQPHIHADYLSRTRELSVESGVEHVFIEEEKAHFPFVPVKDQQELNFGNTMVKIMHTPGHTWESSSLFNQ